MFHTYVTASSGRQIDIDRAMLEMDDGLLAEAEKAWEQTVRICNNPFDIAIAARMSLPPLQPPARAQLVWDRYCAAHLEKYGAPFEPDISLTWDR